jgi:pyruvate ferredoxin oxidoreductase delta subunit
MNAGKGIKLVSWKEITHGSHISEPGNAQNFSTGDWRSQKPVFIKEKCKNCLLCYPVCPDSAVLLNENTEVVGFDMHFCKGCLVCKEVCHFNAIEVEVE